VAEIPTFSDLYSTLEAQVKGDPSTDLNDFTNGSALDTLAGVAATAGREVIRWALREFLDTFLQSATGDALDYLVDDLFGEDGPNRDAGESDESFRDRAYSYLKSSIRGTPDAVRRWILTVDGRADAVELVEDDATGITDAYITPGEGVSDVESYLDELKADVDDWRALGGPLNIREQGA